MAMNFILMSSLQHSALLKIVTNLWNQDDVWASTREFLLPILELEKNGLKRLLFSDRVRSKQTARERIRQNENWLSLENMIMAKVKKLPLPGLLKEELLRFIKPIGLEILVWKIFYYFACELRFDLPCEIYWTQRGTVDQKKTAEQLIVDDCLDISTRYQLACVCCLKSDIEALWNRLSKYDKEYFSFKKPNNSEQHHLVKYWTCIITRDMSVLKNGFRYEYPLVKVRLLQKPTPDLYLLEYAALEGNKAATEYFLEKSTHEGKKDSLFAIVSEVLEDCNFNKYIYNTDVICFLLSRLDEDQRIRLFERHPSRLLLSLMNWPYQSFFMEAAKHVCASLHEFDYVHLLNTIVFKVIDGFKDYDYQKLFSDFWLKFPLSKESVICSTHSLLSKLFKAGDIENVRLVLKDLDPTLVKKGFIFSHIGKSLCRNLISNGKWDSLRVLLGECISSKEMVVRIRQECEECDTSYFSKSKLLENGDAWEKFLQILDDFGQVFDKKRRTEAKNGTAQKKLCSTKF